MLSRGPSAPDLAVEILSPGDQPGDVLEKVSGWLAAGTRLVWVIDYERAMAQLHRADGSTDLVQMDEDLSGEHVLPGFRCPLRVILV